MNSNYGTIVRSFDSNTHSIDSAIRSFKSTFNVNSACFIRCFASYWQYVSITTEYIFLFGFPLLPRWYKDVIDQFNEEFNNIKIEIIHDDNVSYRRIRCFDNGFSIIEPYRDKDGKYKEAGFMIIFNSEYSIRSKLLIQFLIAIFLRLMSLMEENHSSSAVSFDDYPDNEDLIQFLLDANTEKIKTNSYRCLCEFELYKEVFMRLDDIEFMNKIRYYFNEGQTNLFKKIRDSLQLRAKIRLSTTGFYLKRNFRSILINQLINDETDVLKLVSKEGRIYIGIEEAAKDLEAINNSKYKNLLFHVETIG